MTKTNKIIITKLNNSNCVFVFQNGNFIDFYYNTDTTFPNQTILIGIVKNIRSEQQAAFVEIAPGINGYLSFDDVLPQFVLNRECKDNLHEGDEVAVMVKNEPIKTKLCSLTMKLTLTGIYTVLTTDDLSVHVSHKIRKDQSEELNAYVKSLNSSNKGFGIIIRTAAANVAIETIQSELNRQSKCFNQLLEKLRFRKCYQIVFAPDKAYLQWIREYSNLKSYQLVTNNKEILNELSTAFSNDDIEINFYSDSNISMEALYSLRRYLSEVVDTKVNLTCGGYLLIEPTETLTVIDVNSGKTMNRKDKEEYVLRINLEAAREIARQLRLRNISGMILVDFINMKSKSSENELVTTIKSLLKYDNSKATFVDITKLGLVEITRQKKSKSVYESIDANSIF